MDLADAADAKAEFAAARLAEAWVDAEVARIDALLARARAAPEATEEERAVKAAAFHQVKTEAARLTALLEKLRRPFDEAAAAATPTAPPDEAT